MKYVYVLHSEEYSDSTNLGVFTNEQDVINLEKHWTIKHNEYDLKHDPTLKLKRVVSDFDHTVFFQVINTQNGSIFDDGEYSYDKVPLNNAKATTKKEKSTDLWSD